MDLEQIKHLNDEQKNRYMALTKLFEMPGWVIIQTWAERNYEESRDRAASASSWDQNRIAVGERIVYDVLRKMEEITEREYSALSEDMARRNEETLEVDSDDLLSHEV